VDKLEGNRPLGRHRRKWEVNIKIEFQEEVCVGMDWVDLIQDRDSWYELLNSAMKIRVP
jgi:hypothetical protein